MRVGVVDVGTNSVRLLVTEGDGTTLDDVDRDLVITRLGEHVDRDRKLGAEPLRRTVAAIAGYVEKARAHRAGAIRIIATSAVRDAANREDFMRAVKRATELDPVLLTGDQEAQLGFLGATIDVKAPGPYLVVDIGGGSTELVRGNTDAERFISLDVGSVRLTERHIHNDPPTEGEIVDVANDADGHLETALATLGRDGARTMIGLAGTITTVAAIALDLNDYDRDAIHHAVLARTQIAAIRERLASMTSEQRRALPAMPKGREDVIVAGVVILERIMDRFGFGECLVSETDILDGVAIDVLRAPDARAR
ncbi:MAG TPA: Ppx/GppA phosphatase family protein [Actinomycetota bacterium]|nr:Ppx/GppA phosphatase family protein [Actinomycetota bacterium]